MKPTRSLLALGLAVVATRLYLLNAAQVDVDIRRVGGWPGIANDVVVAGQLAYVAAGTNGLHILDLSDPVLPLAGGWMGRCRRRCGNFGIQSLRRWWRGFQRAGCQQSRGANAPRWR